MKNFYMLGLPQIQEELMAMQKPGCYWITCNRYEDARTLARQVLSNQSAATLISSDEKPRSLLTPDIEQGPERIPLYSLPEKKRDLLHLHHDFARTLTTRSGLILFFANVSHWNQFSSSELSRWVKEMRKFLKHKGFTLLIISWGATVINLRNYLHGYFRQVDGVAHLEFQQDSWKYRINWWYSADRLFADRAIRLSYQNNQFIVVKENNENNPLSLNDENNYLAEEKVLEGAPPLSRQWQLFNNNELLFSAAQQANAATVIFNLSHNEQITSLANRIHSLRRLRGNALKIVVREMQTSLRYSDERLLLACGVNAIVPFGAPLSRFLTLLEALQGQQFTRHVPANLDDLIGAMQPLQQKGFLKLDAFCESVNLLISNTLLPENGKGLLVALRPVPELRPEQALTLCKPRRFGDLVTVLGDRLYLFLSSCRFNDLDTALTFIFSLPHDELFSNRMVWFEDNQIVSEIRQMKTRVPGAWHDMALKPAPEPIRAGAAPSTTERKTPQPLTLKPDGNHT